MANQTSLFSGVAIGAVLAAGTWYGSTQFDVPSLIGPAEASVTPQEMQRPTVGVFEAERRSITEWDEYTGRFEPVDEVAIRARVSGYLDAVHFEPGDIVQEGELLFTIDPRPYQTALAEAEARVAEAKAAAELARTELERAKRLSDNGHISQSVLDSRLQDAAIAQASIASAEAAVDRAVLELGFTQIYAPVTGRISDDFVSPGNLISAGAASEALTTIVSLDPIHFVFDATEQQFLDYVRANSDTGFRTAAGSLPVAVQLVDETDFGHQGRIDFIDNQLDRGTGTIRGRAVLNNPNGTLTPGMFGRMRLATDVDSERILIPDRAIGSDQAIKFVMTVAADGTVNRREVTLHGQHDGLRIVDGLSAGEQVIVTGLHVVAPGAQVAVSNQNTSENTDIAMR